jgi:hypothetical protein
MNIQNLTFVGSAPGAGPVPPGRTMMATPISPIKIPIRFILLALIPAIL